MLTVDYDRLGLRAGERLLLFDLGRGVRHAPEAFRRGAQVVPLDRFASELTDVPGTLTAMADAGEAADGAAGQPVAADAVALPFPDG